MDLSNGQVLPSFQAGCRRDPPRCVDAGHYHGTGRPGQLPRRAGCLVAPLVDRAGRI